MSETSILLVNLPNACRFGSVDDRSHSVLVDVDIPHSVTWFHYYIYICIYSLYKNDTFARECPHTSLHNILEQLEDMLTVPCQAKQTKIVSDCAHAISIPCF